MKSATLRFSLLISLLFSASAAQGQSASTPEAAARQYFTLMQKADWNAAASLMHPDALKQFKSFFQVLAEADSAAEVTSTFFGVQGAQEFRALPAAEVYSRMMRSLASMSPEMMQAMTSMRGDVIGSVPEGSDVVHVVYRMHMGVDDVSMSKLQVISFRRSGDIWLGLLTGDMQGLIQSLSRATNSRR